MEFTSIYKNEAEVSIIYQLLLKLTSISKN